MTKVIIYDATLREGNQSESIAFSVEDKLRITTKLDELGVHYIEGGWPGSNPTDALYFKEIRNYRLNHAVVTAFGSTARAQTPAHEDNNLNDLIRAKTETVTIFGKSWDLHVKEVLKTDLESNLATIQASVAYLKQHVKEVFFDAEHFFDGFKDNPGYALSALECAVRAGADTVILCDTNGGALPHEIRAIVEAVTNRFTLPVGIHTHNDSDVAVANTLIAVQAGCSHVQGTINGFGERCGNANLCSIIPNLAVKMNIASIPSEGVKKISEVSRFVSELANLPENRQQPFVGRSAFAHKAGIHVDAVRKASRTYEHVPPAAVGNIQRILISNQSGKANILKKATECNLDITSSDPVVKEILTDLKELERQGFQFDGAEASFELRMRTATGQRKRYFDLVGFRVIIEKRQEDPSYSEATIMVRVGGNIEHTAAVGNGPVNAIDNALRKALERFYPELKHVSLIDYKVRVISGTEGTGARVRVLIESGDRVDKWGTVGVSENIIEASWQALTDSITYKLLKEEISRGKNS